MGLFSKGNDDGDKPGRCAQRGHRADGHHERSHGGLRRVDQDEPRRGRRLEANDMLDNGEDHHMPRSWP